MPRPAAWSTFPIACLEKQLPFLAWTIVPYWSSDLLYALSLLICGTRRELNVHVARLVVAQVICVACFLLFPLRYEFVRPEIHGFFGGLFGVLLGFDRPFNEAPSLHVCLVVILWVRFRKHLQGLWGTAMNAWLVLIAISTMTTYQHQFLDVPTGALAGLLTLALVPEEELDRREQRFRLATFYFAGALFTAATACKLQGWGWILLWPALALLLVAAIYAADRPGLLRHFVVRLIVTPYTIAAWINSRWWTRGESGEVEIADGVWLGRAPRNWAAHRLSMSPPNWISRPQPPLAKMCRCWTWCRRKSSNWKKPPRPLKALPGAVPPWCAAR